MGLGWEGKVGCWLVVMGGLGIDGIVRGWCSVC